MIKPDGQLVDGDRNYLYALTLGIKPQIIIESGTWKGGGSTYFLVSALKKNQKGILYTYEEQKQFYDIAFNFYNTEEWKPYIKLFNEDFVKAMININQEILDNTSLIFLDGGDETVEGQLKLPANKYPEHSENLASFKILEKRIKTGTSVVCHDWLGGRGEWIKIYLDSKKWEGWKLLYLNTNSVGMSHLIKL